MLPAAFRPMGDVDTKNKNMSREILFRGKVYSRNRRTGEYHDCGWVYGDFYRYYNGSLHSTIVSIDAENAETNEYSVELTTVSQSVGLKDLKGKKIFEGDIVKWGHVKGGEENPIRIAVVKFNPDLQFEIINYKMNFLGQNKIFHYGSFIYTDTEKWIEVIGNVHENPELLSDVVSTESSR